MTCSISVIIPTFNASKYLPNLLNSLHHQVTKPNEINIIDSSSTDQTVEIANAYGCEVTIIPKNEFNHGSTRNVGAKLSKSDIMVFMTQDALPVDNNFLGNLTKSICKGAVAASYARQVPYMEASPTEAFARRFNYPPVSNFRSKRDIPKLAIKAFFLSDVASAIKKEKFWSVGGFPEQVITNEDMVLCSKLMRANQLISYESDAMVFHSHNYSLTKLFKRYFDIGVFYMHSNLILSNVKTDGEGFRFVRAQIWYLLQSGNWLWIPTCIIETLVKYTAFQIGKNEHHLSASLKARISSNPNYWNKKAKED